MRFSIFLFIITIIASMAISAEDKKPQTIKHFVIANPKVAIQVQAGDIVCFEYPKDRLATFKLKNRPKHVVAVHDENILCGLAGPFKIKKDGIYRFNFRIRPVIYS